MAKQLGPLLVPTEQKHLGHSGVVLQLLVAIVLKRGRCDDFDDFVASFAVELAAQGLQGSVARDGEMFLEQFVVIHVLMTVDVLVDPKVGHLPQTGKSNLFWIFKNEGVVVLEVGF